VVSRTTSDDRGQVLPLMVLVVLVAMGAALLLGRLGVEVVDRARARTAADAAALAGVDGGRPAAEQAARDNGGRVRRFVTTGGATEVEVQVGGAVATARARAGDAGDRAVAGGPRRRHRWRAKAKWIGPGRQATVHALQAGL
jgi:hypothetical protein